MEYVFTYWEGKEYPFTSLCINSISKIFKERHVHLTPKTIADWVPVSKSLMDCDHLLFRSDYIRTMLLQKFGGWWFDSDIILLKDPSELVKDENPQIWNLIYKVGNMWVPLVNCGILYTPKESPWINSILSGFTEVSVEGLHMTKDNEDIGQDIYERFSVDTELCRIGHEHIFNSTVNVDADYKPFWDGRVTLDTVQFGLHIGASLSRWASLEGSYDAHKTLTHKSLGDLVADYPKSFVAQYCKEYDILV